MLTIRINAEPKDGESRTLSTKAYKRTAPLLYSHARILPGIRYVRCTLCAHDARSSNLLTRSLIRKPRTSFLLFLLFMVTSSGARAMRGFGAMWLLRRRRCVFLAPQCTALRCPWVNALVLPVVRVPSCARGPPGVLFTAHLHMYNKSVLQYCR